VIDNINAVLEEFKSNAENAAARNMKEARLDVAG